MKPILFVALAISLAITTSAQTKKKKPSFLDKVNSTMTKTTGANSSGVGVLGAALSNDDIIAGLKEALSVGATKSTGKLSAVDGFLKDAVVKVLMPPEAKKVENTLRQIGMGSLVDEAITSVNRAAEDASKSAAPIFLNAIKKMTLQDGLSILKGADTAATAYLKRATTADLSTAFKPVIDSSLTKTNATRYWSALFDKYNKLPTTFNKVNTDLSGYVTQKALEGVFYYVAEEEKKIRKDPAARVNDILKKVFGGK
jgi:hypothetical protein